VADGAAVGVFSGCPVIVGVDMGAGVDEGAGYVVTSSDWLPPSHPISKHEIHTNATFTHLVIALFFRIWVSFDNF
jgi:hypothetical protein